jgi:hypothetical protein
MTNTMPDTDTAAGRADELRVLRDEQLEHRQSIPPDAAFAIAFNLIALAADPRGFKKKLQGLHRALTAVDEGMARLAADRVEHDRVVAADRAEIDERRKSAAHIWEIAKNAEARIADRERHVAELERAWSGLRLPGQPPDTFGTLSQSKPFSGLEVAKYAAAHDGALPPHPDAPIDSVRTGNNDEPFPESTTISRQPEAPPPTAARIRGRARNNQPPAA